MRDILFSTRASDRVFARADFERKRERVGDVALFLFPSLFQEVSHLTRQQITIGAPGARDIAFAYRRYFSRRNLWCRGVSRRQRLKVFFYKRVTDVCVHPSGARWRNGPLRAQRIIIIEVGERPGKHARGRFLLFFYLPFHTDRPSLANEVLMSLLVFLIFLSRA